MVIMKNYLLIIVSVLLNASAQLFIKRGMITIGSVTLSANGVSSLALKAITNMPIIMGMLAYAVSILLWMIVLSRVNVSIAYPFLSIGYIFTAILAFFLFNEPFTVQKILGILIICVGVILLTHSRG